MLQRLLQWWHNSDVRTRTIVRSSVAFFTTWGLSLAGLVQLWYPAKGYTDFHWFNDNAEWLQMDKLGHFFCSFHFALGWALALRWAGVPRKKAAWIGCFVSFFVMLPIEVMDGYAPLYGASWGDIVANTLGALALVAQMYFWERVPLIPKFSFHPTAFAPLRPALLGDNFFQQILKDYNGQTFWMVADVNALLGRNIFPRWLRLAVGYGAEGLLGGHSNAWTNTDGALIDHTDITRYREIFLSVDINWGPPPRDVWWVRSLWHTLHWIKVPAPTLAISAQYGVRWHWLYF
jgi:hypothetical protein